MDHGWVKDVLLPLSIGIVGTAVGSGSLFVLTVFLWKFMMKWCSQAREPFPAPTRPDIVESGEQTLAQAEALCDIEMGPINGAEAVDHPSCGVAASESIPRHDHGGLRGVMREMADRLQMHACEVPFSSHQPLTNADASGM